MIICRQIGTPFFRSRKSCNVSLSYVRCRSCDHLATDSVRSKVPPLSVPVNHRLPRVKSFGHATVVVVFERRTSLSTDPLCPLI